jgi:hypothetical protein
MAQGGAFAGRANRDQAMGAFRNLPIHQRAKRRLIQATVLEGRYQGGERAPKFRLGCHGTLLSNALSCGTAARPENHIGSDRPAKGPPAKPPPGSSQLPSARSAAILPLWRRKKMPRPIGNSSAFLIQYSIY